MSREPRLARLRCVRLAACAHGIITGDVTGAIRTGGNADVDGPAVDWFNDDVISGDGLSISDDGCDGVEFDVGDKVNGDGD